MSWQVWALISAVAAGITSVFAKAGLEEVPPNLGNTVRTAIVLGLCIVVGLVSGEPSAPWKLGSRAWLMLSLSALATAVSWVAFFHALAAGPATPVTAIDRASLIVTMVLSVALLGESISLKRVLGVLLVVGGAILAADSAK